MAFGGSGYHRPPKREEKGSLSEGADSGAGAGARAEGGGGGETTSERKEDEKEDKEDNSKHPDVAWTAVVTMLRHVDAFVKDSKEDPEIIASAYLWKEGRFFPILREALLASSSNEAFYCADTLAGEEKERAVVAVARKVEERWKSVKMIKRGEKAGDAREILLGVLETLEEEMVEAHRVGKLPKKKKKIVFPPVEVQRRTTRVREVSVRRVRYSRCCHRCSLYDRSSFVNSHQSLSLSDRPEMIFSSHVSSPIN